MIFKEGALDVASSRLPRIVGLVDLPLASIKMLERCSSSLIIAKPDCFTDISSDLNDC